VAHEEMLVKLQAMQALFRSKLPARLADIDDALQACRDAPAAHEHVKTLHRLLHTMAGAAGSFGFDALGAQARTFEQEVEALLVAGAWRERDLDRLALLLPQLQVHLEHDALQMDRPSA
jgi:HPt (histidine-containing phosphotransfer) domain-containing protein